MYKDVLFLIKLKNNPENVQTASDRVSCIFSSFIEKDASPYWHQLLTLNAPIATKVVCFSRLLKFLRSLYGKQCGPRAVCSGSTQFASILNLSGMLGNYLQQTTSADDIFRCIFSWRFKD